MTREGLAGVAEMPNYPEPPVSGWRPWHYQQAREWLARAQNLWRKSADFEFDSNGSTDALAAAKIAEVHVMLGDRCDGGHNG